MQNYPIIKNRVSANPNLPFYILIQLFISYTGFLLLLSSKQRNSFLSYFRIYFSQQQQFFQLSEIILIYLSFWMISMLFISHLYFKLFSIFCFAFYVTISNHLSYSKNLMIDISKLILNFVLVYLAIQGSFQMSQMEQDFKKRRSQLIENQNYEDEGWYPLQLPVQDNDMQDKQKQVQRLRYLFDKPDQKMWQIIKQTEQNDRRKKRKVGKKIRQHQLQKQYKEQIKKIDKLKEQKLLEQLQSQKNQEKRLSNKPKKNKNKNKKFKNI